LKTYTDAGWDFIGEDANGSEDIWRLCADGLGYPRLAWEYYTHGDFVCGDGVDMDDFAYFSARDYCDGCGGLIGPDGGIVDIEVLGNVAYMWLMTDCENCGGDVSGDGNVNLEDFAKVAYNWMCVAPYNWGRADFNGDGQVGDEDFDIFSAYWLTGP